ncbi:MAG: T9SS type A sorting domain-containing protein [Ignavibacteria bacterium]|nr:T9SS type A sorting domain-containing protein [Ignavibacteria bacterium]
MSFVSYRPGPYSNYAVVKYDNDGIQQWVAEYNNGGVSLNYIYDMALDAEDNVLVTGQSGGSMATVKFVQDPTSINHMYNITPAEYKLEQNYPNPFNPTTKINFSIPKQGNVTLKIYDVLGKQVLTLINEIKQIGNYEVEFNARQHGQDINLASGIYFYRIESREFTDIKRMILIK